MAHKGDTQTDSDPMPKIAHTIRRNGVYYFNARYPSSISRELTNGQTHFKRSLQTRDWKEAKAKAARLTLEFQMKVEELERRASHSSSQNRSERLYAGISEEEQREVVLRWFIAEEKNSESFRDDLISSQEDLEWNERLQDLRLDYDAYSSLSERPFDVWEKEAAGLLAKENFTVEKEELSDFAKLFRRAVLEVYRRSLERVDSKFKGQSPDPFFLGLHGHSPAPPAPKPKHTIHELCLKYEEDKRKTGVSLSTLSSYRMQFRILQDFAGEETEVSSFGAEEAQGLIDFLAQMPSNATKRYPKLSLRESAIIEGAKESPQLLATKTQQIHFHGISAIFRHAQDLDWISNNPLAKRAVTSRLPKLEQSAVEMFSSDELSRLFSFPEFLAFRDCPANYPRFWVPLLCLFHGMRANEACQLLVEDIKEKNQIVYLDIRRENDEGEKVKQLKNSQSKRRLPLSEKFLKMGFLDFVEAQRAAGETELFPTLRRSKKGSKADALGKWFSRFRKQVIAEDSLKSRKKTLHSFRHSFRRAGRDQNIPVPIMEALGGWNDSTRKSSESDYGGGHSLTQLKKTIDRLENTEIDFSALLRE